MITTGIVVVAVFIVVGTAVRIADAVLAGLPGGVETVAWAFGAAASLAAVLIGGWAQRSRSSQSLPLATVRALLPFAITGTATVGIWYVMFYGSGHYEKGGYERLATALALLLAAIAIALVLAARLVARATTRDVLRVVTLLAVTLLAFVGAMTLPSLV